MRLPVNLLYLTLSILPSTIAVFADDAYTTDYHHELIGIPQSHTSFFHRPRKDDKTTLLYTLSDLGVLGAVRPANGKVVWRQFLAAQNGTSEGGFLRPVEGEDTVVSAIGQRLDAWDAASGRQRWGGSFEGSIKDLEIVETVPGGTEIRDVLLLSEVGGKGILRRINGETGDVTWEYKDASDDVPLQTSTNIKDIFVVSLHGAWGGYNVKVTILDSVTGKKTGEYVLTSKADVHAPEDVLLVGANSAAPIIAWTDKTVKNLKVNILGKSGSLQSLPLKESDGEIARVALHAPHLIQSLPHFLVHSFSATSNRADVYHIDLTSGGISKAYELPTLPGSGTVSTSSLEANVYFTRVTEKDVSIVSSAADKVLGNWPVTLEKDHGDFVHGVSEVVHRVGGLYAVRSAVLTTAEDWVLIHNGAEAWTRVEGLSGAVAAAWAEIPETETLAKTLEAEAHQNPLSAYIHRVQRHLSDLQYLPAYLQALPARFVASILPIDVTSEPTGLERDNFGFNKIVVVATQRGRVYGINAGDQGVVLWSTKAYGFASGKKWDVKGIWVENARSLVTIRGQDGGYVVIQTNTGVSVEKTPAGSWPTVESTAVVDSPKGKWLLTIGVDGNPGDVPKEWAPTGTLVVKGTNGEVRGLKFEENGLQSTPVVAWTFQAGLGQKIINVVAKPAHDPVASIGRVLGDRNVLYKYLNPNVVLVTAVSDESSTASFYLLDSVSGEILHSESYEGVDTKQPITSTISENWFAISLWADIQAATISPSVSKGYQLIVSDLYESDVPNYRGPLGTADNSSSLEPSDIPNAQSALPYAVTQSYLISQPVSHMAVTQTRQGITTRQLLCTIAEQNSIIGIPRTILDPRRPFGRDPTPAEVEEGLFRYTPVLDFDTKLVLSHQREVAGVKDVIATPALLESTSLVFAYGIDIFGTRVAPSAAFDILGKGFNRLSLVSTVLALALGVGVLAPLVRCLASQRRITANVSLGKTKTDQQQMVGWLEYMVIRLRSRHNDSIFEVLFLYTRLLSFVTSIQSLSYSQNLVMSIRRNSTIRHQNILKTNTISPVLQFMLMPKNLT